MSPPAFLIVAQQHLSVESISYIIYQIRPDGIRTDKALRRFEAQVSKELIAYLGDGRKLRSFWSSRFYSAFGRLIHFFRNRIVKQGVY